MEKEFEPDNQRLNEDTDYSGQDGLYQKLLESDRKGLILKERYFDEPLEALAGCPPPPPPRGPYGGDGDGPGGHGGPGGGAGGYICPFESLDIFVKFYSALDSRYSPLVGEVKKTIASAKTKAKSLYERGYTSLNGKSTYFKKAAKKLDVFLKDIRKLNKLLVEEQNGIAEGLISSLNGGSHDSKKHDILQIRMSYLATREIVKKYELFVLEKRMLLEKIGGHPETFVALIGRGYETVVH
jgi:hypothetical protein